MSDTAPYVLMVEDTQSVALLYKSYLTPLELDVQVVGHGAEALIEVNKRQPDLVLLDLRLPDMEGMRVLKSIKASHPEVPIVVMTAHGSIETAVEAMRLGAVDFLVKPCEADSLRVLVNNILRSYRQQAMTEGSGARYQGFVGRSENMQHVYRTIDSASNSKASIFITGESGTGKEVCAEAIHAASKRSTKPFIAINCAAIPKDLIESELFGHIKGAFTGAATDRQGAAELANGGTLFLDEICEMDLDLQTKLLRFIQTGSFQKVGSSHLHTVDVRFVCATNRDPWLEVTEGRFREDLYYRLYVIPLHLPPLRERDGDVIDIAYSLLAFMAREEEKEFIQFTQQVIDLFKRYPWPGNVRQLQNVIRHAVVLYQGQEITIPMLPPQLQQFVESEGGSNTADAPSDHIEPLWVTEKKAIEHAIEKFEGNVNKAATSLEVNPSTLYRKIKQWQSMKHE
jgi:two-component system repressor protein LuxO